jgi:hypothetical protein
VTGIPSHSTLTLTALMSTLECWLSSRRKSEPNSCEWAEDDRDPATEAERARLESARRS